MKTLISLALILGFSVIVLPQSVSKTLKNAEKALGGEKAFRSIRTISSAGSVTRKRDGVTGSFTLITAQPNFLYFRYDLNGAETETGYNGRSAWTRDTRDGLKTLTGKSSSDLQTRAAFQSSLWFDQKREQGRATSAGLAQVNGKMSNKVIYSTPKGASIKLYFEQSTGFLVREEIPFGDVVQTFDFSDHRKINGVMMPFAMTITSGSDELTVRFDDVKANVTLGATTFDFPKLAGEPLADIRALLVELQANEDRVDNILDTYSYIQKSSSRTVGKDGALIEKESETHQLSFYKGNRVRRLIEKNGKPLNEKEQAKEDEEVQKRVKEIEKRLASKDKDKDDEESRRVSVAELLRASRLINPRRERFHGRDVIVFDFQPNPDFDYKNAKSMLKFFGKTAGVMWIDEKDKQVARLEAYLAENFNIGGGVLAKLKKGASFVIEQDRINDEIWLPSMADINLSVRVLMVKGIEVNAVVRSYDYKKFATEVKDAKVGDPRPN